MRNLKAIFLNLNFFVSFKDIKTLLLQVNLDFINLFAYIHHIFITISIWPLYNFATFNPKSS